MKIFAKSFLILLLFASLALAKVSMPVPRNYVEDKANIIDSSIESKLNGLLKELEQKTGVQYIILTVTSLNGVPIDMYSIELAEQWKLGQAKQDNGMLFVISLNDRKFRFEVGYGLEGVITDSYSGGVGREYITPYARKGDYSTGIYLANAKVIDRIAKSYNVNLTGIPKKLSSSRPGNKTISSIFSTIIFILIILFSLGGRGGFFWFLLFGLSGHRNHRRRYYSRGFGGSGGSFGGGGFGGGFGGGGFGGGGGGGFGGGGSSGGW
ncbi:MAG: TPM domain-containing protein [Sedimentisphaeraceae bacterium JB056]